MPWADPSKMKDAGFRPKGTGPSAMETIISSAGQFVTSYLDGQEKANKRAKDDFDMYVTLRKAGYNETQAADKVRTRQYMGGKPEKDVLGAEADAALLKPEQERLKIRETKADIYQKRQAGKLSRAKADAYEDGTMNYFENEDEIPPTRNGLPLKSVTYVAGKGWKPTYSTTKKTAAELESENLSNMMKDAEAEKNAAKIKKGDRTGGGFLQNFFGGMFKGPGVVGAEETGPAKSTAPKVPNKPTSKETKVIKGVTYERGSDGKWHRKR